MPPERGLAAYFLFGPMFIAPKYGDPEIFADYFGFIGMVTQRARFGAMLHTKFLMTGSNIGFSNRFEHEIGLMAGPRIKTIEPGVHLKMSLDSDIRDVISFTYGLNFQFNLPNPENPGNESEWTE